MKPLVAATLSLLAVGCGQFYNGERLKGLIMFGLWLVLAKLGLDFYDRGQHLLTVLPTVGILLLWPFSIYDAYVHAGKS